MWISLYNFRGCPRYPHSSWRDDGCPQFFRCKSTDFCGKVSYYKEELYGALPQTLQTFEKV